MSKLLEKDPPRVNSFKEDIREKPFKYRHKMITSVSLEIISIDEKFKEDLKAKKGFLITNEEDVNEKTGVRTSDGLYSPNFGVDTFSDKITDNMCHCECGALSGSIHEGEFCQLCKTKVQFADSDLDVFGYIPLGTHQVINPAMYALLTKLIGKSELPQIIKFNNKFNLKGKNVSTRTKASPYNGIGMHEFIKNFDEIAQYYRDKRKRYSEYEIVMKFKESAFTHYVIVYSALLRPLVKDDSRIAQFDVNRSYSIILANANEIRVPDIDGVDKTSINENCLFEIQTEFNKVYDDNIAALSSKKGLIRGSIICARNDSSGRCVISPARGQSINEVTLPYAMGVELMRPLLICELHRSMGMNYRDANSRIDDALRQFDKGVYILANYILQNSKNPPIVLIQRSPSLLQESIRFMDIKMIKKDPHDFTMNVPVGILDYMGADFDGDTESIHIIFDNRLKAAWKPIHSPLYHFISRHSGMYSPGCEFIKDSAVILTKLWDMGKNSTYYQYQASEAEKNEYINKISNC